MKESSPPACHYQSWSDWSRNVKGAYRKAIMDSTRSLVHLTGIRQVVPPWTKLEQKNNMGDTGISSKDFSACRLLFSDSAGGNWPYASPLWFLLLKTGIEWLVEEKIGFWQSHMASVDNRVLVLKTCQKRYTNDTFSGRVGDFQKNMKLWYWQNPIFSSTNQRKNELSSRNQRGEACGHFTVRIMEIRSTEIEKSLLEIPVSPKFFLLPSFLLGGTTWRIPVSCRAGVGQCFFFC